jgi:class 3 adenylate cyclase
MKTKQCCDRCKAPIAKTTRCCPHCGETISRPGKTLSENALILESPEGKTIIITHNQIVGRSATGKELLEPHEGVSRRHAQFTLHEGNWFVTDLNSSNGTFLSGEKLPPHVATPVVHGQILGLSPVFEATVVIEATNQQCIGADETIIARTMDMTDIGKRPTLVVFFADIKGSVDFFQEMGTMVAKNWIFKLFQMLTVIIEQHHGKHLKNIGDAMLAVFPYPGEAAKAAKKMQSVIREHNKDAPENERYFLRIGMNVGKVLFENNDVFGNTVNIASRVQAIAPPGRIFVTRYLTDQIRDEPDLLIRFIGQEQLKGVKQPIDVFELLNENPSEAKVTAQL